MSSIPSGPVRPQTPPCSRPVVQKPPDAGELRENHHPQPPAHPDERELSKASGCVKPDGGHVAIVHLPGRSTSTIPSRTGRATILVDRRLARERDDSPELTLRPCAVPAPPADVTDRCREQKLTATNDRCVFARIQRPRGSPTRPFAAAWPARLACRCRPAPKCTCEPGRRTHRMPGSRARRGK